MSRTSLPWEVGQDRQWAAGRNPVSCVQQEDEARERGADGWRKGSPGPREDTRQSVDRGGVTESITSPQLFSRGPDSVWSPPLPPGSSSLEMLSRTTTSSSGCSSQETQWAEGILNFIFLKSTVPAKGRGGSSLRPFSLCQPGKGQSRVQ